MSGSPVSRWHWTRDAAAGGVFIAPSKVVAGSIPIHRMRAVVVAPSAPAQGYRADPDHLWTNAAVLDGHIELVQVFPCDRGDESVMTRLDERNPYD